MDDRFRVFVHVGAPKTGTTFVQRLLWGHRESLARHGVDVPGRGRGEHLEAGYDLRTEPASPADPKRPMPQWEGAWDRLADKARASHQRTVVISEERLAGAGAADAERAVASLAPAEVHIVYTARDLVGVLPAAWQEDVKNRSTYTFEGWLADVFDQGAAGDSGRWFWLVQDAVDVLQRWGKAVPAERIHVIPKPPSGAPVGLLWERFAGLLGIDPACVDVSTARTNASLSLEQTEFLRQINSVLSPDVPEWHYFRFVREVFAREIMLSQTASGARPAVPAERAEQAATWSEHMIAGLAEAGYDVVGDLAELRSAARRAGVGSANAGPADAASGTDSRPDDATVLDASVSATAGLLEHVCAMRDRRGEVNQALARVRQERDAVRAERDRALAAPRRAADRKPAQVVKEALVDLAACSRPFGMAHRAYKALGRGSRAGGQAR